MKILVTGGAGFIGSHVSCAYVAAGHEVAIADNLSTGCESNLPAGAKFFQVDIRDVVSLEQVLADFKPTVVNHHAAQMDIRRSLREPLFDADVNVVGSLVVLELSVKHGVRKIIFASSGGAIYGEPKDLPVSEDAPENPISHYGVAKLAVERYLNVYKQIYGVDFVTLRYANVFGPRQNPRGEAGVVAVFAGQMLRGEVPTVFGDGSKTRDYVYVDDIVEANLLATDSQKSGTFNLGRGVEVSDYGIFNVVRDAVGFEREPQYAPRRPGEIEHIALDAHRATLQLGWNQRVALAEGIAKTVEHLRSGHEQGNQ
jgi:UDP-glucose 4-epimerase